MDGAMGTGGDGAVVDTTRQCRRAILVVICLACMQHYAAVAQIDDDSTLYLHVRLSSITANGTFLPRSFDPTNLPPYVISWDYLLDLDIVTIRSTSDWTSSAIGIRVGYGAVLWTIPNVYDDDGRSYTYYTILMEDKDLLSRYSIYSSRFRLDFLLGLTVRFGDHYVGDRPHFSSVNVRSLDTALKLGAEFSFDLWNPVLSLHLRAGCVLFGYETIEPSFLGVGLSLGYQRYFQPSE